MSIISKWKLKRELDRIRQQIISVPYYVIDLVRQYFYDRSFPKNLDIRKNHAIAGSKYVVFLSFEPAGLSRSTLDACNFFSNKGYNVMLVSNNRLSDLDIQSLTTDVWCVVQRPNFGYDFGGYRDGIKLLKSWGLIPDKLIIVNDSIWFPIDLKCNIFSDFESRSEDFLGLVKFTRLSDPSKYFFESYFLFVNRSCFESEAFYKYWENYKLSDIKYRAVHQGERGFSKSMFAAGHSHDALFSRDLLSKSLQMQSATYLRKCLEYGAYSDEDLALDSKSLLLVFQDSDEWKRSALVHMKKTIERRHFHASFPYASMTLTDASFLKKNKSPLHLRARQMYVKAVQAGDLPAPSSVDMWIEIQKASIS